jgi:hypothetical protein
MAIGPPHLGALESDQLAAQLGCRVVAADGAGHQQLDADQGDDADDRDGTERRAPAQRLAEERAQWHAEDVRRGQAGEHDRHGGGLAVRWHQGGGHDGIAESRFPAMNNTISHTSTVLRGSRVTAAVSRMAPTATAIA